MCILRVTAPCLRHVQNTPQAIEFLNEFNEMVPTDSPWARQSLEFSVSLVTGESQAGMVHAFQSAERPWVPKAVSAFDRTLGQPADEQLHGEDE